MNSQSGWYLNLTQWPWSKWSYTVVDSCGDPQLVSPGIYKNAMAAKIAGYQDINKLRRVANKWISEGRISA